MLRPDPDQFRNLDMGRKYSDQPKWDCRDPPDLLNREHHSVHPYDPKFLTKPRKRGWFPSIYTCIKYQYLVYDAVYGNMDCQPGEWGDRIRRVPSFRRGIRTRGHTGGHTDDCLLYTKGVDRYAKVYVTEDDRKRGDTFYLCHILYAALSYAHHRQCAGVPGFGNGDPVSISHRCGNCRCINWKHFRLECVGVLATGHPNLGMLPLIEELTKYCIPNQLVPYSEDSLDDKQGFALQSGSQFAQVTGNAGREVCLAAPRFTFVKDQNGTFSVYETKCPHDPPCIHRTVVATFAEKLDPKDLNPLLLEKLESHFGAKMSSSQPNISQGPPQ